MTLHGIGNEVQSTLLITVRTFIDVIGASLSEPHTSESNSAIVSIYIIIIMVRTSTESKYKILILRIMHYVCEAHYA